MGLTRSLDLKVLACCKAKDPILCPLCTSAQFPVEVESTLSKSERYEMKTLVKFVLLSTVSLGVFGCSADSTAKDAEEARATAVDARANAADADARVTAADAHVRAADAAVDAADADARVVAGKTSNSSDTPVNRRVVIPSGTLLKVALIDAVDSNTSSAGDLFLANLSESVLSDGVTLLQKGTQVRGRVVDAEGSGRVKGRASISLKLTEIIQGDRTIAITTDTYSAAAESQQSRDAKVIAGGAGVGAVIGAIAGGKKGAVIGAATGGGAGTGVVLATKGEEIHYGPETRLNFTLTNSVQM